MVRLASSWRAVVRAAFSRRFTTLWIIVIVNLAIAIVYLLTRSGATTAVRIEANGNHYRTYVDGELALERTFSGRPEGGIGFLLPQDFRLPGLPSPYGIDWVRVTDAATGEVLFEDSFDGSPSPLWQDDEGSWWVDDGVYTTDTTVPVTTGFQPWGDYVMEAKLRNITEATLYVRTADARDAITFDIGPFRTLGGRSIAKIEDGIDVDRLTGFRLEVSRVQTIRSILAMLLRPFPVVLLMVAGAALVALVLRFAPLERVIQNVVAGSPVRTLVAGLSAGTFALLLYLLYAVGEAMPHVPDSVAYVFQAKIFASMSLTADVPAVPANFSYFNPPMLIAEDGRWFSVFPFGHSLFLAVGETFGAIWLIPPLLGAASIVLIYRIGHHMYGEIVGVLAAVLLFSSPFFQMTASNFMSHNTAVFVLLLCLFFVVRPTRRRLISMFMAGVFLGLLFNIRPLAAVAFMPVLGGLMAFELVRSVSGRRALLREDLAFAAGSLLLLGAYFLYNQLTTGDLVTSPYALGGTFSEDSFGFAGSHSFARGLQNGQELLALFLLVANGWPLAIGLAFTTLPFILGTRQRWDYVLAASIFSLASLATLFHLAAVMHGPRLWYEIMPFLILLTARGAQCLAAAGSQLGDWLADRVWHGAPQASPGITRLAVYGLVAGLVAFSLLGWFGQRQAWRGDGITTFTPAEASQLEGFNFTDRRLADLAADMELEDALVFVEDCGQWFCYGSVFWNNSPGLEGDVVWAELKQTQGDLAVLEHYPDRDVYIANYFGRSISPATVDDISARLEDVAAKERQDVIDAQTSTPQERDL
ncbi:MAG: glycosyltransferase family 39 protein, partial [Chloroflexi bacterium]|nr:glycosyltransferase family 39 protein [Chloroflexota bacterium]